ncbi:hypothetical protein V5E97_27120 [Singulisphaera sp. Ch08]|uniref:Glycosyltransferase RgtA/B/C/D-like domain-containing protein n=1 Tax=Singulisphaera sp. Ch08 TaxID=3120278 RepID=A0AAU7CA29_9BACT
MSITQVLFALTCVVSVGVGIGRGLASVDRPIWERFGLSVLPFLGCTVAWHWLVSLTFHSAASFRIDSSLAAAMGLSYGYWFAFPGKVGLLDGAISGPVFALAYSPAGLLNHSGFQILVSRGLSLFYYYGPAAWLLLRDGKGPRGWRRGWRRPRMGSLLLFFAFVLLTTNIRSLRSSPTEVQADAPALALAALAVVLMVRGGGGRNPWTCAISLLFAVLAVWAKQLAVPLLLLALPAYALATGGGNRRFRLLLPGFVGGLAMTLIVLAAFEAGHHGIDGGVASSATPLRGERWVDFLSPLIEFQEKHAPLLLLLAVGIVDRLAALADRMGSQEAPERFCLSDADWILFLLVGFAELPFSVLGYFGTGANESTMSFSLYFLSLGSLLMLKPLLGSGGENERAPAPWGWYVVIGLNLMLATLADEALGIALVERKGAGHESVVSERFQPLLPPCSPRLRVLNSESLRA